jgi:hypothetical protein
VSPVLMQAFIMTFLAEWGDRSQIATIAMGADYNPWGIIVGASLGHGVATSGACVGGRMVVGPGRYCLPHHLIGRFRYIAGRAERCFARNSVWAFNLAPALPHRALTLCPQLCMGISPRRYTEIGPLHFEPSFNYYGILSRGERYLAGPKRWQSGSASAPSPSPAV